MAVLVGQVRHGIHLNRLAVAVAVGQETLN
jgi:hypothetical protein